MCTFLLWNTVDGWMDIYCDGCFLPLNSHWNTRSVWLDYRPTYAKQVINNNVSTRCAQSIQSETHFWNLRFPYFSDSCVSHYRVFHPCIFATPAFSTSAFSVAPSKYCMIKLSSVLTVLHCWVQYVSIQNG